MATAVLADLHFRLGMHVRLVTLQFTRQGKTRATNITRVRPLGSGGNSDSSRSLHNNVLLLLQIAGCRGVHALVHVEQVDVIKHQAADVALVCGTRIGRRGQAHVIDESVVINGHRLYVQPVATFVVRRYRTYCPDTALNLLHEVDIVVEWKLCGGLTAFFVFLVRRRHIHLRWLRLLISLLLL